MGPEYFAIGLDGLPYAVFSDNCYTYEYAEIVCGVVAHFGGYENAVCIQRTIGI